MSKNTAKILGITETGKKTHGHRRGAPKLYTRDVVRSLVSEARKDGKSLCQMCADKGLVYISLIVAKGRYTKAEKTATA